MNSINDSTYTLHESMIQTFWNSININELIKTNIDSKQFRFLDGPPFITGNLHLGHVLVGILKRTILNYKRSIGFNVTDKLGFDCHGLPVESLIEKKLGFTTATQIIDFGIDNFNKHCKDYINNCSKSWEPIYQRIARWTDFDSAYKTMDASYMESVWSVFSQLWKKGLIYKGFKVTPYSCACRSVLSNFEAGQNYKEHISKAIHVKFKVIGLTNTFFIAWTTTPWTLLSNAALCVNPDADYAFCISEDSSTYIIGAASATAGTSGIKIRSIDKIVKGSTLTSLTYQPLLPFTGVSVCPVFADTYVSGTDTIGTAIVHLSPAHGEDDFRVCLASGLTSIRNVSNYCFVDDEGRFTATTGKYAGILVFDAIQPIIDDLKAAGCITRITQHKHQYPYCWRTDKPLIYKAVESWYMNVTAIRDDMIRINKTIKWHPAHIGTGRFNEWLTGARDWCISRSRYFGTPLPVWVSDDGTEQICIGSIEELCVAAGCKPPTDLHPEHINKITIISSSGKILRNVGVVFDCWFESGAAPFATGMTDGADFIVEGLDQTRGWFYTLLVLSTALRNKAPSEHIMCTGLVLDETGLKFSKKYGNAVDTDALITKYGADTLGLFLISSQLTSAENLKFSESKLKELKTRLVPYINAVKFYEEHSKDIIISIELYKESVNFCDKWICEYIELLTTRVRTLMDDYQISKAVNEIIGFIEDLTNWYIKFNRDRLRGLAGIHEKNMSLSVLRYVILTYARISAPFMPFTSEYVYQIVGQVSGKSVHLEQYPIGTTNQNYSSKFELVQRIIRHVRAMRCNTTTHTSAKTPIKKCIICHNDVEFLNDVAKLINTDIQADMNCIDIEYRPLIGAVERRVHPIAKMIGRKYKDLATAIITAAEKTDATTITSDGFIEVMAVGTNGATGGATYKLGPEEFEIVTVPILDASNLATCKTCIDGELMVQCDFTYDDETQNAYEARRVVTTIQNMRKVAGLHQSDAIIVQYNVSDVGKAFMERNHEYIVSRTGKPLVAIENDKWLNTQLLSTYTVSCFDGITFDVNISFVYS